jgi:hypothetical protein
VTLTTRFPAHLRMVSICGRPAREQSAPAESPSTRQRTYVDISSRPFQIPLGALIPFRVENLLPACKNLGVTHITNGCFRVHPVEWNIGEAAGVLAAFCLARRLAPRQVRHDGRHLAEFQRVLSEVLGVDLAWPNSRATAR